ncbi:MAG: prevent-host-death protein [Actinomycetales bacterium]|nr:prevent-host-death protein [Actinomycetales bacterium]
MMSDMTSALRTFQSSALSRHSAEVFAAADAGPVEVTRRDGDSLVLMSSRLAEANDHLLEFAAQLIAATTDDRGTLADRLSERLDWMLALTPEDRDICAAALVRAARASFSTGQSHLALAELASWRSTATALAQGLGNDEVDWLDEPEKVARP